MKYLKAATGQVINLDMVASMEVAGAGTGVVNVWTTPSARFQVDFGVDDTEAQRIIDEATQAFDISDF